MRRLLPALALVSLLAGCGADKPKSGAASAERTRAALSGAAAPLAELHRQSGQILGGGPAAFRARLDRLKGHPVVVNKWGSWCGPCRAEFPFFQRQATTRGKEIAFLGVDGEDNDDDAKEFLREYPVPYPSYRDRDLKVSAVMKAVAAFPSTAFYSSRGRLVHVKQGSYATERKLIEDIERYAR